MPRMIVINGTTNTVSYTLSGTELLRVESVSADVNTHAAGAPSFGDVIYRDASGFLIARSRSSEAMFVGSDWIISWAPELPDSNVLGNLGATTVVTTGLADTVIPPNGTITVTASDPAAIVTQARLWVDNVGGHASEGGDELAGIGAWAFVPGPGA